MTVRIPAPSRRATLKASAPPANESGIPPANSSDSAAARFTVTAWRARPDMYIVGSRSKTPRVFSTSRVFDSLSPKASPRASAAARRRRNIGIASSQRRSCPKAASGTTTSAYPRSPFTMPRTRSGPSSVGLHFTCTCRPRSSMRWSEMRSISSGGQPCIVERVTESAMRVGIAPPRTSGQRLATMSTYAGRCAEASSITSRYHCTFGRRIPARS